MTIKAITFDLWDTIVDDDSDEPKRAAQGLRSKRDERRHQVWEALNAHEPIDMSAVSLAYDTAEAGFNVVWKELFINWTVEQRLRVVLNGLGRSLPDDAFAKLVADTGDMEVDIPPDAIEGIGAALADLDWFLKNGLWEEGHGWGRTGMETAKDWKEEFCRACYEYGKQHAEDCNVIYACITK